MNLHKLALAVVTAFDAYNEGDRMREINATNTSAALFSVNLALRQLDMEEPPFEATYMFETVSMPIEFDEADLDYVSRLRIAIDGCIDNAEHEGYVGERAAYQLSGADHAWITLTLERAPTDAEWAEVGWPNN